MQHYEYIGEVLPDGRLPIAPSIAKKLIPGQRIRVRIEQIADAPKASEKKELDAATLRLLERMKNAPRLGVIQGELSREEIYGERVDERY
jgi:hypothetical protein